MVISIIKSPQTDQFRGDIVFLIQGEHEKIIICYLTTILSHKNGTLYGIDEKTNAMAGNTSIMQILILFGWKYHRYRKINQNKHLLMTYIIITTYNIINKAINWYFSSLHLTFKSFKMMKDIVHSLLASAEQCIYLLASLDERRRGLVIFSALHISMSLSLSMFADFTL